MPVAKNRARLAPKGGWRSMMLNMKTSSPTLTVGVMIAQI
jgi:hypothetical protein